YVHLQLPITNKVPDKLIGIPFCIIMPICICNHWLYSYPIIKTFLITAKMLSKSLRLTAFLRQPRQTYFRSLIPKFKNNVSRWYSGKTSVDDAPTPNLGQKIAPPEKMRVCNMYLKLVCIYEFCSNS